MTASREAAQALRESEAFSTTILESSPDCIKVLDADGRLLRMNAPGQRLMEIDDFESIRGMACTDLWPVDGRGDLLAALEDARRVGTGRFRG
ncbi:MAG TPA: PAS domain-containing protein, partial [Candidatus Binatia bacterium]|nr:PAS domain-containing protein [Candidatus Binatia bacterium]